MFTASTKRKENIAEYILYMWQIEDLIRAHDLDLDKIRHNIIDKYNDLTDIQRKELTDWYESLIDMMRREGVAEKGHLQLNINTLNQMQELHTQLLHSSEHPEYAAEFYKTLPFIVELRSRQGEDKLGEIETCITALYGILMLRLSQKEITPDTLKAVQQISRFIALLAHDFKLDQDDKLWKHED
ncbi:MAG: DUF4924 family protein [Muribaculum sp.]|nr:DUF4924 family protein [Muribaculum sp.]